MTFKKLKDVMESLNLGHVPGHSRTSGLPSDEFKKGLEAGKADSRAGKAYDDSDESPEYQRGYEKGFDSEDEDVFTGPERRQSEGFYDNSDDRGNEKECEACGGPMYLLGTLGDLDHWRCRNCGALADEKASTD
jgi:hypothetical protein